MLNAMFCCTCCTNGAEVETTQETVIALSFAARAGGMDSEEFTCSVARDEGEWGMTCDSWGDCIHIVKVQNGKIKEYNDTADPDQQLAPGAMILQINGSALHAQSMPMLKHMTQAEFKVVRPVQFVLAITKDETEKWGLKMNYQNGRSSYLRVTSINEGAVRSHNKLAEPASEIRENDFIISANDVENDPQRMLEVFSSCSEIELVLARLP